MLTGRFLPKTPCTATSHTRFQGNLRSTEKLKFCAYPNFQLRETKLGLVVGLVPEGTAPNESLSTDPGALLNRQHTAYGGNPFWRRNAGLMLASGELKEGVVSNPKPGALRFGPSIGLVLKIP